MPHIVTGALVDVDRVLLGHRSPSRRRYPNLWALPGGHVESGETEAEALVRELHEELGVGTLERDLLPVARLELSDSEGGASMRIYRVRHWQGAASNRCPDEHDRLGWFAAADLAGLALAHAGYRPVLHELLAEPLAVPAVDSAAGRQSLAAPAARSAVGHPARNQPDR